MSLSPISIPAGREALRLSVQTDPAEWKKRVEQYKQAARSAMDWLHLRDQGAQVSYSFMDRCFRPDNLIMMGMMPEKREANKGILCCHRAYLVDKMMDHIKGEDWQNIKEFFISKMGKGGYTFYPEKLGNLLNKIEQGKIKTLEEKAQARKDKVIQKLTRQLETIRADAARSFSVSCRNADQLLGEMNGMQFPNGIPEKFEKIKKLVQAVTAGAPLDYALASSFGIKEEDTFGFGMKLPDSFYDFCVELGNALKRVKIAEGETAALTEKLKTVS